MKLKIRMLLFVIVFFPIQLMVTAASAQVYDMNSPEVKSIASKFSMQGHADHDISTCQTMQTYYTEIAELLNEGKTSEEIVDYYYGMYGEEGLRVPKKEGFSLLAWTTPFIVITIAGVGLFFGVKNIISRQSGKELQFKTENVNDEVENEIVKSMIEEERKKHF